MKRAILKYIMVLGSAMLAVGCIKNDVPEGKTPSGEGMLVISGLDVSYELTEKEHNTRAGAEVSGFNVRITSADTGMDHVNCAYSDIPSPLTLSVGNYTLNIESHRVQDAVWDVVYYSVSRAFEIKEDETTTLSDLVCRVSNILVSVEFSEEMQMFMGEDCAVDVSVGSCGPLTYDVDTESVGAFKAVETANSLVWDFTGTLEGDYYESSGFLLDARAGEHRKLKFNVEKIPTGDLTFIFVVSAECTTWDVNLNEEVSEEVIEPVYPVIEMTSPYGFTERGTIRSSESVTDMGMAIRADEGISSLAIQFTTDNEALAAEIESRGITLFDLANPGALETELQGYGFPTGAAVSGKTLLDLDFSDILLLAFRFDHTDEFDIQVWVRDVEDNVQTRILRLELIDDSVPSSISIEGLDGFILDDPQTLSISALSQPVVGVSLDVPAGIATLSVDIVSEFPPFTKEGLESVNLTDRLDLTDPGELEEVIAELNLPYGNEVLNKTELVVDISSFLELIFILYDTNYGPFDVNFAINVEDNSGNTLRRAIMLHIVE